MVENIDTTPSQHAHKGANDLRDLLSESTTNTLHSYKQKHNGNAGTFPTLCLVHDTISTFEQPSGALKAEYDKYAELDDCRHWKESRCNRRYTQGYCGAGKENRSLIDKLFGTSVSQIGQNCCEAQTNLPKRIKVPYRMYNLTNDPVFLERRDRVK